MDPRIIAFGNRTPRAFLAERLARGEIMPDDVGTAMRALGYGDGRTGRRTRAG